MAQVSKEEIMHIAQLASLNLDEREIESYRENLENILNFVEDINSVDVNELGITIGSNERSNVFREDKVIEFKDTEALLQNAPAKDRNMFKIPKVL